MTAPATARLKSFTGWAGYTLCRHYPQAGSGWKMAVLPLNPGLAAPCALMSGVWPAGNS